MCPYVISIAIQKTHFSSASIVAAARPARFIRSQPSPQNQLLATGASMPICMNPLRLGDAQMALLYNDIVYSNTANTAAQYDSACIYNHILKMPSCPVIALPLYPLIHSPSCITAYSNIHIQQVRPIFNIDIILAIINKCFELNGKYNKTVSEESILILNMMKMNNTIAFLFSNQYFCWNTNIMRLMGNRTLKNLVCSHRTGIHKTVEITA